ncbi:MAG: cytochrome c [Chloroflexi bacterium]|nr:cytochrome c [Chloroflexota bacterium]
MSEKRWTSEQFKGSALIALSVVALLLDGCSDPPPVARASEGRRTYIASCAACHGPDARGVQGLGKDLVSSAFVKGLDDEQLVEFIKSGRDATDPLNTTRIDMPPRGGNLVLTDAQIRAVVAYIRTHR